MKIAFDRLVPMTLITANIVIAFIQSNIHSLIGWIGMLVMTGMAFTIVDEAKADVNTRKAE